MPRRFLSFPQARQAVSTGMLSALIQMQRQDLLTGLVDILYPDGEQALLFFTLGTPFLLFFQSGGDWRKVPSQQWNDVFARPDGEAGIVPLGGDALRMCILTLEAISNPTEEILIRPPGLKTLLGEIRSRDAASLLWVRDDAFQGLLLVPGRNVAVQDVLVFSPTGMQSDGEALAQLDGLGDRLLRVSQYEFPEFPPFMREYALRIVFLALAEPALQRFEQLAGDTLVESLGQEVNRYAFHQGWKIQFFGRHVQHRQFFQDVGEATTVYRSLFRLIQQYARQVVGPSLADNVVAEGVAKLPLIYRDIFERQNFIAG